MFLKQLLAVSCTGLCNKENIKLEEDLLWNLQK